MDEIELYLEEAKGFNEQGYVMEVLS